VKILALSADPKEASATMKKELGLSFPLLSDEDEEVSKRYGLLHKGGGNGADIPRPANLLLDAQGVIRWAVFTENVRVRPHPEAILEAAKKLR
jgi:peroxiredoxin